MTGLTARRPRRADLAGAVVLAVLAYLPALASSPGRMPADSKLYLYLDPARLLGDAATTFDPRQFAGWVPHQHIAYLWPTGPWYWCFDVLGVPDWVAHRLWIGTLFVAAGFGVRWCARLLGLSAVAAVAAALVYQLSPYVLPYVSRTSVMLLPWAGLGWVVGFTIRATRRSGASSRLVRWGDPAAIALVVLTVGAVNATALAMVVPAPVLWLIHSAWLGEQRWRATLALAARAGVLATGVSLWWAVMLVIQGRHGADVLPYSESLADVSFTASAPEVWRSLGYWLFYVRDRFAPTTTASLPYLASSAGLAISFAVTVLAVAALAGVRWRHRRFCALLVAAGLVLAVGVHPIEDRSPLMRLLTGDGDEGLALALRSSTRAVPVALLGFALAIGSAVHASGRLRVPRRVPVGTEVLAASLVGVVALANLPALWKADLVDPALARDEDPPAAWVAAAATLDDPTERVLQLPGLEFGAFRWGYTVDQPLPGLAESPLITRDLLPLGSAAAMDLVVALDDRIQDGVLDPDAVAPIARLLGAATIWLTNDAAYDRFDVTAPSVVAQWLDGAAGVGEPTTFGEPGVNVPALAMDDARAVGDPGRKSPVAPVALYPVEGAPSVARAAGGTVVVSGSGDGLVDAAAAGLLPDDSALVYSATATGAELTDLVATSRGVVVTDSNRARARHWRGSQDTTGFTESASRDGAAPTELTEPAVGDARLPVFAEPGAPVDPATLTTAEQRGPVVARASAYGQPFAWLPEHRPFMAVDGDPATAWTVGEHGDPVGESFEVTFSDPAARPASLTITQYAAVPGQRQIGSLVLQALDGDGAAFGDVRTLAVLPAEQGPTTIPLGLPAGASGLVVTIDGLIGGVPGTESIAAGVGFAEFDLGLGPTREVVRVPTDAIGAGRAGVPLTFVFTRVRTDPADRWRDDPEPALVREFATDVARDYQLVADTRLDARADDAALAGLLDWPAAASTRLLGALDHAAPAAIDGDPATSWITGFGASAGATLTIDAVAEPIDDIAITQPAAAGTSFTRITEVTLWAGGDQRVVRVEPDAAGRANAAVDPPLPAGPLTIEISGTEPAVTLDRRFGDRTELPAAIVEIELPGLPALPDYREQRAVTGCIPLATLDAEPVSAVLAAGHADGPRWLPSAELVELGCGPAVEASVRLDGGTHQLVAADTGLPVQLDRVALSQPFAAAGPPPTVTAVDHGRRARSLAVTGCTGGCWVVLGEGFNDAWSASVGGVDLGEPVMLDGGFTGWRVPADVAGDGAFEVAATWTAQRALTIAEALSAVFALGCAATLVARRVRHRSTAAVAADPVARGRPPRRLGVREAALVAGGWAVAGFLLAGWRGAVAGAAGGVAVLALRRRGVPELALVGTVTAMAVLVVVSERRWAPPPGGGWPHAFERYHWLGMVAIATVVVVAVFADDTGAEPDTAWSVPSAS